MTFIYLMINLPFLWKCKIGISRNVKRRRRNIDETTKGWVLKVWALPMPFAENLEKELHRFFRHFHSPFEKGSGRTEWYITIPVLPLAWLIINFMFLIYWSPVWIPIWWIVQKY